MGHENSTLPSRYHPYEEALNQKLQEAVKAVVDGRGSLPTARATGRFRIFLGSIGALVAAVFVFAGGSTPTASRLPAQAGTVFSAELAGASASAEEILPPSPPATTRPAAEAPSSISPEAQAKAEELSGIARTPHIRARADAPPTVPAPRPTPCRDCQTASTPSVVLFDETGQEGVHVPAPTPAPPLVLNVGTRLKAYVATPTVTGPVGTPVTALVVDDVVLGDRVALPSGTRIVGDAVAIEEDDRVQVIFTAAVIAGRTTPLNGVAIADDGRLGNAATVVRKSSKGKRGLGKLLGVTGSVLTFGLIPGGSNPASAAASQMAAEAARDLAQVEARWTRSDKVLRAGPGPVTVYLRQDLVIP